MLEKSSGLSTDELLVAADRQYFDEGGRKKHDARIRAMMQVLLSDPGAMREQMRQAAETGGLLDFPPMRPFPLRAETAVFSSESELRELLGNEMAEEFLARRQEEIRTALAAHCAEAERLMRDLTTIASARLGGVAPEEILTADHLRVALTTEMVSQSTLRHIRDTRQKVRAVIAGLMEQSGSGVQAAPLAQTMRQIGQLCQVMTQELERLSAMAEEATRGKDSDEKRGEASALAEKAREIFAPFIHGNHVITMEQLGRLESFLSEAGAYNRDIGVLLEDGLRAIREATEAGRHGEASKIEEAIGFDRQVEGFEGMIRALDHRFATGASILAFASAGNRTILKSTPPGMLKEAETGSGLPLELLLRRRDEELVLPAGDGLELE